MDAQRGFLEAVREAPDDDLHRLAWADWCEDHDLLPRAAFLRACVEASHLPVQSPQRADLEAQAELLLDRHERSWLGPLADLALDWRWRRGCVERLTVRASALLEAGEDLLNAAPIRELRLLGDETELAELASSPALSKLATLDLGVIPPEGEAPHTGYVLRGTPLWGLLRSSHLEPLHNLRLAGHDFAGPLVHQLIEAGYLRRLRSLDLTGCHAFGNQAARLLAATAAPHLESLFLLGTNLSEYGIRDVLDAPHWPNLRDLCLPFSLRAWQPGPSPLIASPHLLRSRIWRLEGLLAWFWADLRDRPGVGPVHHLCLVEASPASLDLPEWPGLSSVRRLAVIDGRLGDSSLRHLLDSPYLQNIEWLDLSNNRVGGPTLKALMATPGFAGLETLSLKGNFVGAHGAGLLADLAPWRRLRSLSLEDTHLAPDGLAALAGSPLLQHLRSLRLSRNPIEDEGLHRLLDAGSLRLRELYLDDCNLDTEACDLLCDRNRLPHLRIVSTRRNLFSARDKDRLRAHFGPGWLG